ncbi:MAG: NAD(P)/FAD-dependent oxidoreductase [Flavobacteriaceae bacterium]
MISFWEKTALLEYDLIVIGGGITGLFCALSYREKYPNASIAILERGLFSSGASTKNAGFACFGSLSELAADLHTMSEDELVQLVDLRLQGLQKLRSTLGDKIIEFESFGGYELFFDEHSEPLNEIDKINKLLSPLFSKPVFSSNPAKINAFGFNSNKVKHLVENPFEGQIHTGKMMRALRSKANEKDITFFSNIQVLGWNQDQIIEIRTSIHNREMELKCTKLAVCTNGFTKDFYKQLNLLPGRGMVLVTKPIKNLQIKGAFHYNSGYNYFRNINDRVLLGGGRNLDFNSETTTAFGINPDIKEKLISDLSTFILPNQAFEIEMEWSGIMAFGTNKKPLIKKMDNHIALGVRLGGMGIAIGSKVGEATAKLLFD